MIKPSSDPVEHQSRAAGQGPSGILSLVGARGAPPRCGSRLSLRQATEGAWVAAQASTADQPSRNRRGAQREGRIPRRGQTVAKLDHHRQW